VVRVGNLIDLQVIRGDDHRSWGILNGRVLRGRVDPHGLWQIGGVWPSLHEALGMRRVRGSEHVLSLLAYRSRHSVVNDGRRQEAEPAVPVLVVVPTEEVLPERPGIPPAIRIARETVDST